MYICICKGITDSDIHDAVENGCQSMRELRRRLGVASECGRCASCARDTLRQARTASSGTPAFTPELATA